MMPSKPRRQDEPEPFFRDLRWGIGWGLFAACFYSLVALGIYAFQGSRPFESKDITLGSTVAVYIVGGLLGGTVVGLLRPLGKRRAGAMLLGVIAMIPVSIGFVFILFGPISRWGGGELFGVLFTAVFLGGYGGWEFWEPQD
jgi:hypothetical protein